MLKETLPQLIGIPDKIFVSVDDRTGRSTLSFSPREVGVPIVRESDAGGAQALVEAKSIAASYSGCVIVGPHFHTSRPAGSTRPRRKR